jgi:hypothetical protein
MKARVRIGTLNLAVLFLVFFAISRVTAPYETSALAQEQKSVTTVVPDDKYGNGGTLETTSDKKTFRPLFEKWKDKDGKLAESHSLHFGADNTRAELTAESWDFWESPTKSVAFVSVEFVPRNGSVPACWMFYGHSAGDSGNHFAISADKLPLVRKLITKIEEQFAKDGTIPKIPKDTHELEETPKQGAIKGKGNISGTIEEPSGYLAAGAWVKVINSDTGEAFQTTSDSSGLFRLNLLPVGRYKVEIKAQGFKTTVLSKVAVRPQKDAYLGSVKLTVGDTGQVVEVTKTEEVVEVFKPKPEDTAPPKPATDPCMVSVADAEKRIQAHLDFIQTRSKAMSAAYYSGVASTVSETFQKSGVKESMQLADSWAKEGIGSIWLEAAAGFYQYHLDTLNASLRVIRRQQCARKSELDYLDSHMQTWKDWEREIAQRFEDLVLEYTKEALLLDKKSAYMNNYFLELDRLSRAQPYPSGQINSLTTAMYAKTKEYEPRIKQMEQAQAFLRTAIQELTDKHLFTGLKDGSTSK